LNPSIRIFVQAYSKEEKELLGALQDVHIYRWEDTLCDAIVHDMLKHK